jgi:hypothetical protein
VVQDAVEYGDGHYTPGEGPVQTAERSGRGEEKIKAAQKGTYPLNRPEIYCRSITIGPGYW